MGFVRKLVKFAQSKNIKAYKHQKSIKRNYKTYK